MSCYRHFASMSLRILPFKALRFKVPTARCIPWRISRSMTPKARYIAVSLTITVATIVAAAVLFSYLPVHAVNYDLPQQGSLSRLTIGMVTQYVDVNVDTKRVMVEWYPQSLQDSASVLVDIYFDPNILTTGGSVPALLSSEPPTTPIFQFNTSQPFHGTFRSSTNVFRTVTILVPSPSIHDMSGKSMQDYPWDVFTTQLHLFAINNATGESVGIQITQIFGTPVNFNVKVRQGNSGNTVDGLWYQLDVTRSAGVKTLVIIVLLTFWLVGISLLWIAVAYVMYPEAAVEGMYALPVATLFAFTSLRANLPGAPAGFGARIDFISVLPNLALLAISSAVMLIASLTRRNRGSRPGLVTVNRIPTQDTYPATVAERFFETDASSDAAPPRSVRDATPSAGDYHQVQTSDGLS